MSTPIGTPSSAMGPASGRQEFSSKPVIASFQAMPTVELVERYRRGTELIERRLLDLDDEQLDTFFKPEAGVGRWSCRVLMGHLADAELVFVHRMRRAVAEDKPVLAVWDENAFIDSGLYGGDGGSGGGAGGGSGGGVKSRPVAGFVAVIHTLRMWHGEWLRTLSREDWERVALHPERGEQSVRTILNYATWHHEHHVWYLNLKMDRLLGG